MRLSLAAAALLVSLSSALALAGCDREDACYESCRVQAEDCVAGGTNPSICDDFRADCEQMCFAEPPPPP